MEINDFLLGLFSGGVLIIISQVIGHYFARRNLKAQQEHSEKVVKMQQEHSERVAKMQLFHEDKKKALMELDEVLKKSYKTFPDFKKGVESFLDGSSGIFLPEKLCKELKKELQSIDAFMWEKLEDIYGPPPEEEPDDYEAWAEAYPEDALDAEIRSRLMGLKGSMRDKIKKYISEE